MKTDVVDLLTKLNRWLAELDKLQVTCDGETARRVRGEIVLRAIMASIAVETGALAESILWPSTTSNMKNENTTFSIIQRLDDALDAVYPTTCLFPLTKPRNITSYFEPTIENQDAISDCITRIASGMKDAITSTHGADLPGLFYERYVATGKNKKGIVYTPAPVCKFVVKRALESALEHSIGLAIDGVASHDENAVNQAITGLANFSVIDPACGTGPFLVEALRLLHTARERMERITSTRVPGSLAGQVHGIDEDPLAVDIARFNVSIVAITASGARDGPNRDEIARNVVTNLVVGNAITDLAFQDPGARFDAVVGNPPYVNYKKYLDRIDRGFLEKHYRVFDGQADLSYYFFELHSRLLKDGGTSGQISSRYFMQASHARHLREFLAGHEIVEIVDMNDCDVFGGIGIHPLLFFFKTCRAPPDHELVYRDVLALGSNAGDDNTLETAILTAPTKRVQQSSLDAGGWCLLSTKERSIQAKFNAHPSLGDLGDVLGGAETGHDEAFAKHVVMEREEPFGIHDGKRFPLDRELVHPWLKNGDIREYHHAGDRWCIYVPPDIDEATFEARYPKTHAFLSCFKTALEGRDNGKIQVPWYSWRRPRNVKNLDASEKIVIPYKAPRLRASIDTGKSYCSYDVTVFVPRPGAPSLAYITGVLNSQPTSWYFATRGKKMGGIYEFYSGPVSNVRVPTPDAATERAVVVLVQEATSVSSQLHGAGRIGTDDLALENELRAIQERIDGIVLRLVGVGKDDLVASPHLNGKIVMHVPNPE